MSLGKRLNLNGGKGAESSQDYETILHRMKLLSKSQTAFLKAYMHQKLSEGEKLVSTSIELLNASGPGDAKVEQLKKSLKALRLSDIEVDVTSTKLELHEEVALLRSVVEGGNAGGVSNSSSGGNDKASLEKIASLETENKQLSQSLAKVQSQLAVANGNAKANGEGASATAALQAELTTLKTQLAALTSQSDSKDKTINNLQSQLDALSKDKQHASAESVSKEEALAKQLQQSQQATSDAEAKLAATTKESQAKYEATVAKMNQEKEEMKKEIEERLEGEKEELMEAMAQEIEEMEATKAQEQEELTKEVDAQKQLVTSLRQANQGMSSQLLAVSSTAKSLVRDYQAHKAQSKQDLQDIVQTIGSHYKPTLVSQVAGIQEQLALTQTRYRKEMTERKRLHNVVQELKGNIRVFMRCRPPTKKELEQFGEEAQCVQFPNPGEVKVFNEKNREKLWEFDEVFDTNTNQEQVYTEVSALVTSVMDGFNVCIFAYGQTGSGKTWTMSGPADNRGVNTRALEELFHKSSARSSEWKDTITVSLLEVYNEEIRDLLAEKSADEAKLEVKMGPHGNHVPGLVSRAVDNIDAVLQLIQLADKNRSSTATNMNEHSSRSHMILTATVISEFKSTGAVTRGKLNLVDLAGSERINKSGATGQALKEAQNINKSLSALGDVIAARAAKQGHVPFRNSTLTFLLQDSISQDSKTLMIVCVSPVLYNSEETFCSLNFAGRVRTVELGKASKNTLPAAGGAGASSKMTKK